MHSIHLEFNTVEELRNFFQAPTIPATMVLPPSFPNIPVAVTTDEADPADIVMSMLEDECFTLRSTESLCEKSGLTPEQLFDLFYKEQIQYVTRTKRGTNKQLVGLADRN